jgi:GT2 family glycosyltransferase
MDVSIIIINYNTFQLTCDCIKSVIQKTIAVTYEIILVDNASTECDADFFKPQFPGIILIKSEINLGFAGGNNLGLKYSSGENILLLNSDTLLLENSIYYIFNECKNLKRIGAATIKLTNQDGSVQFAAGKFPSVFAHFLKTTRLRKIFKKDYNKKTRYPNYDVSFSCDYVWGTFFYFPVKNLKYMNGKLSETYFMYNEDQEWCYNFKRNQLNNYYFSNSKIIHHGVKSSSLEFKNGMLLKNHLHFIKNNYGFWHYYFDNLLFKIDDLELKVRIAINRIFKILRSTKK